jgi:hypothetical protein
MLAGTAWKSERQSAVTMCILQVLVAESLCAQHSCGISPESEASRRNANMPVFARPTAAACVPLCLQAPACRWDFRRIEGICWTCRPCLSTSVHHQ